LNVELHAKRVGGRDGEDGSRVKWLKDEIARVQVEINKAQGEYKEALESRLGDRENESPNIDRLQREMEDIKRMLQRERGQNVKFSQLLNEIEDGEEGKAMADSDIYEVVDLDELKREKRELKEEQSRLDEEKKKYREDMRELMRG